MTHRLLIIDDHTLVAEALAWTFRMAQDRYEAITACTLDDGVRLLGEQDWDAVLLDLGLPGCQGIDALRAVRAADAEVALAIVSAATEPDVMRACLRSGADGFIPKTALPEVMRSAVQLIIGGGKYVPPEALAECASTASDAASVGRSRIGVDHAPHQDMAATMPFANAALAHPAAGTMPLAMAQPARASVWPHLRAVDVPVPAAMDRSRIVPRSLGLTERQADVLWLMLDGLPNKLICRRLDLAEGTVKVHVSAVLRALGVHSRTQAVVAAARLGLCTEAPRVA